jgi:peptide deformylase
MAVRPILVAPHPALKAKAKPVSRVDDEVRQLMDDMLETMYQAPGIGLAAPQVGVPSRVLVVDVAKEGEPPQPLRLANPEILWASEELAAHEEGCLSVPEHYAEVMRPTKVRIRYRDYDDKLVEIEPEGLLATCLQHEIDHLEGVLFIDRLSALKRNIILRKLVKARKLAEAE